MCKSLSRKDVNVSKIVGLIRFIIIFCLGMSFLISGIDSFILEKSPTITTLGEIWKGDINFSRIGKEEIRKSL